MPFEVFVLRGANVCKKKKTQSYVAIYTCKYILCNTQLHLGEGILWYHMIQYNLQYTLHDIDNIQRLWRHALTVNHDICENIVEK